LLQQRVGGDGFGFGYCSGGFLGIGKKAPPPAAQAGIGILFLFVLPPVFLITGLTVWLRRRRR